jgi:hypothetical protein
MFSFIFLDYNNNETAPRQHTDGPPTPTAMSPCSWGEEGVGQRGQAQWQDRAPHYDSTTGHHTMTTSTTTPDEGHDSRRWTQTNGDRTPNNRDNRTASPTATVSTCSHGMGGARDRGCREDTNTPGQPSTPLHRCEQLLAGWMRGAKMTQATTTTTRRQGQWQWQWQWGWGWGWGWRRWRHDGPTGTWWWGIRGLGDFFASFK